MRQIITIWIFLFLLASGIRAQEVRLDTLVKLKFDGITLKQALSEISQQYSIKFSYSDSKIPVDKIIIYADFTAQRLGDVLHEVLYQHKISYSIIGNQIVLFPFDSNQTITVYGKVIDNIDGSPIPFANISLSGTNKGTSSNEDGEFELSLSKLPSELIFSHLSYEKKLVYVYDETNKLVINLMPAPRQLQEITVKARGNKNTYYNIVKKAYDRLSNTKTEIKYGKAFYRQKSKREDIFTEIFEIFYDIKYSANGIMDWAVQEGRYAFQNNNEYDIFLYNKNFTLLSRMFPIRQPDTESYIIPVNPEVKKLYELDLKDVIQFDERLIGVISFTPKPEVTRPAAKGELYIDFDNFQVLKMKGTITDENLEIVGFADNNSTWENYELDFEISFIDDLADQLLMDYVQIDHSFDYFFNEKFIGKIRTSSLLSFYEHYIPVKNKKLGGAINYKSSDMEIIDGVGYNPIFWSNNPIVKRTPLEEKLIRDFEENEAFGVVFMNNNEEVVLLPDKTNGEKAREVISRFESMQPKETRQKIYLHLDQNNYGLNDHLRFTAYVLDRWSLKPLILGSVLYMELIDLNGKLILEKKYDINNGISYGELDLSQIALPGKYHLKAYTNIQDSEYFEKGINISNGNEQNDVTGPSFTRAVHKDMIIEFFPESGSLLQNIKSKVVFIAKTASGTPVKAVWQLKDSAGNLMLTTSTNYLGIGMFEINPQIESQYFLIPADSNNKWLIPEAKTSGVTMRLDKDMLRSIHVELYQKPELPKEVHLLFTAGGKVFSFYEKQLNGLRASIDFPIQHFPGGINTLLAIDQTGTILAKRSFFISPDKLNIQLESATWKSKRNNRVQLEFKINDQNGSPILANLSAVCSTADLPWYQHGDIRNYLYFGNLYGLDKIDLSQVNDSTYELIDRLILVQDSNELHREPSVKSQTSNHKVQQNTVRIEELSEPVFAEVTVSGNFGTAAGKHSGKLIRQQSKQEVKNNIYWIPSLNIDEHGLTTIDYKTDSKNQEIYVNIQGISQNGHVGYVNFIIDPYKIKTWKK